MSSKKTLFRNVYIGGLQSTRLGDAIYQMNYLSKIWEKVYEVKTENGFRPFLESHAIERNDAGDRILYFQVRAYNHDTGKGKIDVCAVNVETKELLWRIEDIEPYGNSSVDKIQIYKDKLFFEGFGHFFCIAKKNR